MASKSIVVEPGRAPNTDMIAADDSHAVPRLIITRLVVENFKSYAGRHEIGPFHKVGRPAQQPRSSL